MDFETTRSGELLAITVRGAVTIQEAASVLHQVLETEAASLHLWDFRGAQLSALRYQDVEKLRNLTAQLAQGRGWRRVAFVGGRDVDFGIGRMFQAMGEAGDLPFKFRVFRDHGEATAWIGE